MSELESDEASPLGFSAAEVRAFAEGERRASFHWRESSGISYGPESGDGQATVQLSVSGPARFARVDDARSQQHCEDHVRLPVTVALSTAGGALDESFPANLIATSADEALLDAIVPAPELGGAFAFTAASLGERRFVRLEINLSWEPEAFAGYLFGGIEEGHPASGSTSFHPVPLACWGDPSAFGLVCAD